RCISLCLPTCPAQSSRFVLCHIYYFGISRLSEGLDFGVLWHLIRPRSLRIWFLFVSTDTAVWLTSLHASRQTSLPLAWLRDVTPALKGLSPVGTVNFLTYIHHSRHTQHLRKHEADSGFRKVRSSRLPLSRADG